MSRQSEAPCTRLPLPGPPRRAIRGMSPYQMGEDLRFLADMARTPFAVPATARLQIHNQTGSIKVMAWGRNEMRVRAEHGSRDGIRIDVRGSVVQINAQGRHGMAGSVDYEISVPKTTALGLGGPGKASNGARRARRGGGTGARAAARRPATPRARRPRAPSPRTRPHPPLKEQQARHRA